MDGINCSSENISRHRAVTPRAEEAFIPLKVDQVLTQDATGTMVYLQFEAIGLPRIQVPLAVSYVDHNTLQVDSRNPDDHRYLQTAAARFGAYFSPPGNGICHQLHLENFARPGAGPSGFGQPHPDLRRTGNAGHGLRRAGYRGRHGRVSL